MHEHLEQSNKPSYKHQKQTWFLDAVALYCDAVSCLAQILKQAGLKFCYPKVSSAPKELSNYEGFDLVLASKLIIGSSG